MSLNIHLDYETRSKLDVNKIGAWNYAKHPSTEILCLSWSIGNGEIHLAHPAFPKAGIPAKNWPPKELFALIRDRQNKIWAHNAFFERVISFFIGFKRLGWPKVLHEQWRCTMSIASYHALPRKLEFVAKALNTYEKDMAGNKVMLKCSSPDKDGEWHEDRDDLLTTFEYNKSDIAAEREIHNFLGDLPPFELAIWQLDQKINCVGIPFDIDMAESAVRAVSRAKAEANIAIFELTKGAVKTTTLINEWHAWTEKMGYPFKGKSLKQELIDGYLHNPKIPKIIKEAIKIKKSASAASVDKYKAVLRLIDISDNRVRDGLYYFGAGTGRYAARGVQIQNLPKGYTDKAEGIWDPEEMGRPFMDEMCDNIVNKSFDINQFYTGHSIFKQLRNAARGVIKAKPGYEFLVVDYSTIEARVVMWLADDQEAIRILKESCIYCDMATTLYGYEIIKGIHKDERQLGKQAILGCFNENTLIYTDSGLKKLKYITKEDLVYDGLNWVNHEGVKYQGWKKIVNKFGIRVTPDHEIFINPYQTVKFQELLEKPLFLKSALLQGQYKLRDMLSAKEVGSSFYGYLVNVIEIKSILSGLLIFKGVDQLDVMTMLRNLLLIPGKIIGGMLILFLMMFIGLGYLIDSVLVYLGAITQKMLFTNIRENGGLKCSNPGEKTEDFSYSILSRYQAGIIANLKWTASMLIKGMNPVTLDSLQELKTWLIKDLLRPWKKESENWSHVYDIVNAGPNHRFMIHTELGPMIVHNCGYGMGFIKFFLTLQSYGIEIPEKTALALLGDDKNSYLKSVLRHRIKIIKAGIDINTHLLSLAACKKIVVTYRAKYDKTVKFWYDTEDAAKQAVENPGEVFVVGKTSWSYDEHRDFLRVLLPSGRCINYHQPRLEKEYSVKITARDKKGLAFEVSLEKLKELRGDEARRLYSKAIQKGWSIDPNDEPYIRESSVLTYMKPENGKSTRTSTYSGKLVENISQGIARDFMCHSMLLADKKGYNLIMTVHDEIVSEEKKGTKNIKEFEELLCILPDWGEGFPVGVEGFVAERYRK